MGKIIPLLFLGFGFFLILQIVVPLINFKLWELENIEEENMLVSPVTQNPVLGVSIKNTDGNFPAIISSTNREIKPYSEFLISIPKLEIDEARVFVESNDLSQALIHLPGSALPGEKGNLFISGHSAIPIVYNGSKNYGAIFAKLSDLKKGDLIKVTAGGEFTYEVLGFKLVDPKDLSVISAPDGVGKYISLMTCVPPGLNTKRLVVLGKM